MGMTFTVKVSPLSLLIRGCAECDFSAFDRYPGGKSDDAAGNDKHAAEQEGAAIGRVQLEKPRRERATGHHTEARDQRYQTDAHGAFANAKKVNTHFGT